MKLRTITEADVRNKKVLLREDYNVPLAGGRVADDFRIRASLPTLEWLVQRGAKVAICAHLGRPGGKVVPELRLAPVAACLSAILGSTVEAIGDSTGDNVREAVEKLPGGGMILLENLRFDPGEDANGAEFASALSAPFDLFVNDAFGVAHRSAASTVGAAKQLPAYAGLLLDKEVQALSRVRERPTRPYIVIVGGKKAKDKLGVLTDLLDKVDGFVIGGGVAFTFLKAKGYSIGNSVVDDGLVETIRSLIKRAQSANKPLYLPEDFVVAKALANDAETTVVGVDAIPDGWSGLDIGPATIRRFSSVVAEAGSVVWAGPMGAFEFEPFSQGTKGLTGALAKSPAFTVVGGGETAEAVLRFGQADSFDHLSTGGGATLSFLRGEPMPPIELLRAD